MTRSAPGWQFLPNAFMDERYPVRRSAVGSTHDIRFDGLSDLFLRAHGASVIDVGMNRGHVAYDFAINGARLVHGCDIHEASIVGCRMWFSEIPQVQSQFEVVDLTKGPRALDVFGQEGYDIVLFIGVYHKLKRSMDDTLLSALVQELGRRSLKYFAFNGYWEDVEPLDFDLGSQGLRRVHTSELAYPGRPAAIWMRHGN